MTPDHDALNPRTVIRVMRETARTTFCPAGFNEYLAYALEHKLIRCSLWPGTTYHITEAGIDYINANIPLDE